MLETLRQLNDNQVAILGCLGAIGASYLLLTISYHSNPANRSSQGDQQKAIAEHQAQPTQTERRAA